jgi:hypothetical protein
VTDLVLTTTDGLITTATPGQEITFVGTGFAPYSTVVISIYSAPTVLGSVVTDRIGNFSKLITVPPGLSGKHTVTAQGVDPAGNARAMNLAITVLRVGAVRGAMLPTTGARPDITLLVGVLTVAVGGLLVALSTPRRRRVPSLRRAVPEGTAAVPAAAFRTSIRLASQGH